MYSHIENSHLIHISGDPENPYTMGKLCAKGYSFSERNYHRDRLKYPYYQKIKGSGKFKQITWENAFDLIISEMTKIQNHFGSFLPLALYKGSGNIGVHHFVSDEFFSSLGRTTRIVGSRLLSVGMDAFHSDFGDFQMSDPSTIKHSSMVIIWGANPASTNIHLMPIIIEAKVKGAKIVVIDPLYTPTVELADLFIQISPGTDGALANVLIKDLIEENALNSEYLQKYTFGFEKFAEMIKQIDKQQYLQKCGVTEGKKELLLKWLKGAKGVSHVIGSGLQKHSNGRQSIRAVGALAFIHGDIGKNGGGIFLKDNNSTLFNNQYCTQKERKNRIVNMGASLLRKPSNDIEMLWISCANPLIQEPKSRLIAQFLKDIPFIVTVDQFMTPTAKMANLVLPTTTHFEEMDMVESYWYKEVSLNEKAISPYYESRSEWNIMKELALRLNKVFPQLCTFPIHSSEEEYLNAQINNKVFYRYHVKSISDLKERSIKVNNPRVAWDDMQFTTETGKYQFYLPNLDPNDFAAMPLFSERKAPAIDFPFWLITPHHPYTINSQFHFLKLTDMDDPFVGINQEVAKKLGIINGELVKVFNEQDDLEIKAIYDPKIPNDILMIYQRWYPDSQLNANVLVPFSKTNTGENGSRKNSLSLYDTFVNVSKL
jgi:anaerobic selenocysteine-containing dehydrogenase